MNTQYKKNLKDAMTACKNYTDKKIDDLKLVSVSANPTLAGTEADLTGLEVDGTKYKVSSGGGSGSEVHLYKNTVTLYSVGKYEIYLEILSSEPTEFTTSSILTFLNDNDYCHGSAWVRGKEHLATGFEYSSNAYHEVTGIVYNTVNGNLEILEITTAGANRYAVPTIANITNHIVQIF